MAQKNLKIVVLISGNGSNLQAIIDAIKNGTLNATISSVISNRSEAFGLQRAQQAGIPTQTLNDEIIKISNNRDHYDNTLAGIVAEHKPDLIVLAGFMHILSSEFVRKFQGRIINIHPSLLPKYRGLDTHRRALAEGENMHGCSIHFVTEQVDGGPIIAQASCAIAEGDTPEILRQRVHKLEHQLYPLVIKWFSERRLQLTQDIVLLDNKPLPAAGQQVNLSF